VILMPVGLLAGLPAGQIESILLHELAHIRRHDYLVNLVQMMVESLVFYHPAVWWISGVIRAERENCSDDLAVAAQGDPFAYAAALTALESYRGVTYRTARQAVLAATGGSLVKRVRRLLVPPEGPRAALTPVFSTAILTITLAAAMVAWQSTPKPLPQVAPAPVALPIRAPAPGLFQSKEAPPIQAADAYRRWLKEDVAYIITKEERAAFQRLPSDPEREHFIEQFWLRRDPTPGTPENEFKEEHYRRIAYANEHFASDLPGWKTDRGRIYITYGPPDEKEKHPTPVPSEQWLYRHIEGIGTDIVVEFTDPSGTDDYRMTSDPSAPVQLKADTPKAGATVQPIIPGGVLITVPLTAYGDQLVRVEGRVAGRKTQLFGDSIQGPAPIYTQVLALDKGSYRLEVTVKDMTFRILAADSIEFEVK